MKQKLHFLLAITLFAAILLPGCDQMPKALPIATATPPASMQPGLQLTLQALPYADQSQVTPAMLVAAQGILEKRAMAMDNASFAARLEGTDRIVVEIRGGDNIDELAKALSQTGYIELIDGGANPPGEGEIVATSTGGPDIGNGSPTPSHTYQTIIKAEEIDAEKTQVNSNPTTNTPEVDFVLKGNGPQKLADFTTANVGHVMPVVLDKRVLNAPRIVTPLTGGNGVITGLTLREAERLVAQLRAGTLPVRLRLLDSKALGGPGNSTPIPNGNPAPIPTGKPAPHPVETARTIPTTTQPVGVVAITPPVTEASVKEYIAKNRSMGEIPPRGVHVKSIQFGTVAELKAQLQSEDPFLSNYPLDEPVVYVTLGGEFPFYDIDNVEHVYTTAFRVFNGRTGNELMNGVGPK